MFSGTDCEALSTLGYNAPLALNSGTPFRGRPGNRALATRTASHSLFERLS